MEENLFDFEFTVEKLDKSIRSANREIHQWFEAFVHFLPSYEINTANRVAAFVAQTAHESGNFNFVMENLNYSASALRRVWPTRFTTDEIAAEYERDPDKIANYVYANRMGNGDEASGDGWRYRGRGLIQITGKNNYAEYADSLGVTLEQAVEQLMTFDGCVHSACWFWNKRRLNYEADNGDIKTMTRKINGGYTGLDERTENFHRALEIFNS